MKKLIPFVILAIASMAFATGCDDDKPGGDGGITGNAFVYDGQTFEIKNARVGLASGEDGDYHTLFFLPTAGTPAAGDPPTVIHMGVTANLFGSDMDLTKTIDGKGTYDWWISLRHNNADIFHATSSLHTTAIEPTIDLTDVKSGTMKVTENNGKYTVTATVTTDDGKTFVLQYSGTPTVM